eukprot:NODE_201_length_13147_cov_1.076104.p3 type:complete len:546 gc:universal NODE_201_length_13147_cov_1.076104:195-1832(+)
MSSDEEVSIFDQSDIIDLESLTQEELFKIEQDVFQAIVLFNQNKFNDAIKMLEVRANQDGIFAVAVGCLLFMRAISTFNKDDIDKAMAALELSISVANAQNTKQSYISKFTSVLFKQEMHWITARCSTIQSEANMLSSFLFILQENMTGLLKAGLFLTKGVNGIEEVYKSKDVEMDQNTTGAVNFCFGAIQAVTALLPSRVLKLISIFGYSTNKDLGFDLMHQCESGTSIYKELAPIFLLGIHCILMSFAPNTQQPSQVKAMQDRLDICLSKNPDSVFYLIINSRFSRGKRDLKMAASILQKAIDVQDEWIGIKLLSEFELCMTNLFLLKFEVVFSMLDKLQKETFWSKAFFTYWKGACLDMQDADGMEHYAESLTFITRKFGGKTIAIEQFVMKRVQFFQTIPQKIRRLYLPGLEIAYLFLGFSFMGKAELEKAIVLIEESLEASKEVTHDCKSHLINHLQLLHCSCVRNINFINQKYDLSKLVLLEEINDIIDMDWLKPFSVFEQAQTFVDAYLLKKDKMYLERAQTLLSETANYSGYVLEFR